MTIFDLRFRLLHLIVAAPLIWLLFAGPVRFIRAVGKQADAVMRSAK